MKKGRIVYYYMKCARIGSPENFHHIALAFANEDNDIKHNKLINSSNNEIIKKRKLLIIDDDDLARNLLKMNTIYYHQKMEKLAMIF